MIHVFHTFTREFINTMNVQLHVQPCQASLISQPNKTKSDLFWAVGTLNQVIIAKISKEILFKKIFSPILRQILAMWRLPGSKTKHFLFTTELVPPGWSLLVPPHCEGRNAERAEKALLALWCFSSFGFTSTQQLVPAVRQLCPAQNQTDPSKVLMSHISCDTRLWAPELPVLSKLQPPRAQGGPLSSHTWVLLQGCLTK